MKAIYQDSYGTVDDLELREIEKPVPADDEVLVRVRATSVHPDVWHVLTGLPRILRLMGAGFWKPKAPVPGTDLAGVVESAGKDVTRFKAGDEVFGETSRQTQWVPGGTYAEFATAPEESLELKPPNVTFEQAAAVPTSAVIAVPNLSAGGGIQSGQRVLINGAGGGVGSIALQIAKALGAIVTGVDRTDKLEMIRSLGADHVIDYMKEDFTLGDARYDLIFDIPGNHTLAECKRALEPRGTYTLIGHDAYGKGMHRWFGQIPRFFKLMFQARSDPQLPDRGRERPTRQEIMVLVKDLLASGQLTPHIGRTFPLDKAPDAIRYLMSGQALGKVMISPNAPHQRSESRHR